MAAIPAAIFGVAILALVIAILARNRSSYGPDARIDPLTGLSARAPWEAAVAREVARSRRYGQPFCVALIDLDRPHGLANGVIQDVAQAWEAELRESDLLARVGEGRFAALLIGCLANEARIDRMRSTTPQRHPSAAGIACWNGAEPSETLVERAEQALVRAKRAGGGTIVLQPAQTRLDRSSEPRGSRASPAPRSP